ncbi:GNAT family N-acetyltransferase [Alloscardovia criceti]|uniref:GNAT family N-acetyltransferase n=1 Tax=Alloscardovia criceti TaxID=356828 RepID=UPI0003AAC4BD|nr:GNAT family N-acetyltransferase [Alloscardovia criceti]
MYINQLSQQFSVRLLQPRDAHQIYEIGLGNPQFFLYGSADLSPEHLWDELQEIPPDKTAEDKYVIGYFEGSTMVAFVDLLVSYPDEDSAYIGFFMVNAAYSGKGIGSSLISQLKEELRKDGLMRVELAYLEGNEQSRAFWTKCGFTPFGQLVEIAQGTVVRMQCRLEDPSRTE